MHFVGLGWTTLHSTDTLITEIISNYKRLILSLGCAYKYYFSYTRTATL